MIDLQDYDIERIKREILWKYNDHRNDYTDCDCLLSLRKDMINKRVLAHQEEILPDIIAFNDALRDALKEMYDRAHCIWDSIKGNVWGMMWRLQHVQNIEDYKKKHGVIRLFDKWRFPYGFLYKEDVCWFMTGWIGMTWKESARIVQLMSGKNPLEAECMKHIYLHRGMDNGFREYELNHIWSSLFDRATKKPLPSIAHFVGSMYQYAFLAMLKKDFPEEYQSIKG